MPFDLHNPTTQAPMTNAERVRWLSTARTRAEADMEQALADYREQHSASRRADAQAAIRWYREVKAEHSAAWLVFCDERAAGNRRVA